METQREKPKVKLVGEDGNAFSIMGRVTRALRGAGYSKEEIDRYTKEATSGDYNHLLAVTMRWVDEDEEEPEEEEDEDEEEEYDDEEE